MPDPVIVDPGGQFLIVLAGLQKHGVFFDQLLDLITPPRESLDDQIQFLNLRGGSFGDDAFRNVVVRNDREAVVVRKWRRT